jgi:hypothetical protein
LESLAEHAEEGLVAREGYFVVLGIDRELHVVLAPQGSGDLPL